MADIDSTLDQWSVTAISNKPADLTAVSSGLGDNLRTIQAVVRGYLAHYNGTPIASAGTVDLAATNGLFQTVSHAAGTTAITSFGVTTAGIWKVVGFNVAGGALSITHNAVSLVLPRGATNVTLFTGDWLLAFSRGGGDWTVAFLQKASDIAYNTEMYGAVGDGVTDDSAALNLALASGNSIDFMGKTYACHGLTSAANYVRYYSSRGISKLVKNANGDLFTTTGTDVEFENINFRGEAAAPVFTGHNLVSSGNNLHVRNCGSMWAFARAVLATGQHVRIIGWSDIYQTADATANGYDIEIGVAGTATLYHHITDIYTSQATGGILFVDCGGQVIQGGQFGKLNISTGGVFQAGMNGGMYSCNRILGDITVAVSNSVWAANQFGAVVITLDAGTSGHKFGASNLYSNGYSIVNNSSSLVVMDTFDGYKEGTFVPVIAGTGAAGVGTYNHQIGRYTRIGNRVVITIRISWSAHTGAGNIRITGLPFSAEGSANNNPPMDVVGNGLSFTDHLSAIVNNGGTTMDLWTYATGAGLTAVAIDASAELLISGQYEAA